MRDESKGMLLGLLAVTGFGFTLPVTRMVVAELDPMFIGFGRALVAALVAAVWLIATNSRLPNASQWRRLLITMSCVAVGFPLLSAWAMQSVPASHGGVVLAVVPLGTALVGAFIARERPSTGFWMVSLAGSVIVAAYSIRGGSETLQTGDLALLGAVITAVIGYAMGGQLSRELGGAATICWTLVLSLPFVAVPTWLAAPTSFSAVSTGSWIGFLYLALVSQLFGFFLWNAGLALGGIARVSQTQLVQPFVTIVASVWLLGETIEPLTIGFAVVVISLVAMSRNMPIYSVSPLAATTPATCRTKGD
jgi:drug/metabolite transporter (DMT)-like permease